MHSKSLLPVTEYVNTFHLQTRFEVAMVNVQALVLTVHFLVQVHYHIS